MKKSIFSLREKVGAIISIFFLIAVIFVFAVYKDDNTYTVGFISSSSSLTGSITDWMTRQATIEEEANAIVKKFKQQEDSYSAVICKIPTISNSEFQAILKKIPKNSNGNIEGDVPIPTVGSTFGSILEALGKDLNLPPPGTALSQIFEEQLEVYMSGYSGENWREKAANANEKLNAKLRSLIEKKDQKGLAILTRDWTTQQYQRREAVLNINKLVTEQLVTKYNISTKEADGLIRVAVTGKTKDGKAQFVIYSVKVNPGKLHFEIQLEGDSSTKPGSTIIKPTCGLPPPTTLTPSTPKFSCTRSTGSVLVNAEKCPLAGTNLSATTTDTLVSSCSPANEQQSKCEYACKTGYTYSVKNGIKGCSVNCPGVPQNASICPGTEGNINSAGSTHFVETCPNVSSSVSEANSCSYTCNQGYIPKTFINYNLPEQPATNLCVQSKPCQGAVPENANFCPESKSFGASAGTNHIVGSCPPNTTIDAYGLVVQMPASDFCSYTCKTGFTNVNGKCVADSAQGTSCYGVPNNATACPYTTSVQDPWAWGYTKLIPYLPNISAMAYVVSMCNGISPASNDPAVTGISLASSQYVCQATCNSGYAKSGNTCKTAVGQCTGSVPSNSNLCPGADKNVLTNTARKVVTSCDQAETTTSPYSCRYTCKSGYVNEKGACRLAKCTGSTPSNGSLCPNTNKLLTSDTSIHYGSCPATNTASDEKCVFQCNSGYSYNYLGTGKCDKTPNCPSYQVIPGTNKCIDPTPGPGTPPPTTTSCGQTSCPPTWVLGPDNCCRPD